MTSRFKAETSYSRDGLKSGTPLNTEKKTKSTTHPIGFVPPHKRVLRIVSAHRWINIVDPGTSYTVDPTGVADLYSAGRPGGVSDYPRAWYRSVS